MGIGWRWVVLVSLLLIVGGLTLLLVGWWVGGGLGLLVGLSGLVLAALPVVRLWPYYRPDPSGWVITWDLAEPLQFAAFVGHQVGAVPADMRAPQSPVEEAWQQWWDALLAATFDAQADLELTLRTHADVAPQQLVHLIRRPTALPYDPPQFDALQALPALQAQCRAQWPIFTARWAEAKPSLFQQLRQQGGRVPDQRIVQRALRETGTATVPPFFLRIDFVQWPAMYQRQRSPYHLVLGTHYLEASAAPALVDILLRAVRDLV